MGKRQPDDEDDLLEGEWLLTAPEVALLLHVSRSTIYVLIQRGDLPTVRVGHALRFRAQDVQEYIRRRGAPLPGFSKRKG